MNWLVHILLFYCFAHHQSWAAVASSRESLFLKIVASNASQITAVMLKVRLLDLDLWTEHVLPQTPIQMVVSLEEAQSFIPFLRSNQIRFEIYPRKGTSTSSRTFQTRAESGPTFELYKYNPIDVIDTHVKQLEKAFPDSVETSVAGKSAEGRDVHVVKVANKLAKGSQKVVLISCGIHAREWISPAACLVLINLLLNDPRNKAALDTFEFHVFPLLNPDGYDFSWKQNRLWRKNRAKGCADQGHQGVDLNRNFDTNWCRGLRMSRDPCSNVYCGKEPSSEPELKALIGYAKKVKPLVAFFDVHSYGQLWLISPAYPGDNYHQDYHIKESAAGAGVAGIRFSSGNNYYRGPSWSLYAVGGGSDDYFLLKEGVRLSATIELRPVISSRGFELPEEEIKPTGSELLVGILSALYHYEHLMETPITTSITSASSSSNPGPAETSTTADSAANATIKHVPKNGGTSLWIIGIIVCAILLLLIIAGTVCHEKYMSSRTPTESEIEKSVSLKQRPDDVMIMNIEDPEKESAQTVDLKVSVEPSGQNRSGQNLPTHSEVTQPVAKVTSHGINPVSPPTSPHSKTSPPTVKSAISPTTVDRKSPSTVRMIAPKNAKRLPDTVIPLNTSTSIMDETAPTIYPATSEAAASTTSPSNDDTTSPSNDDTTSPLIDPSNGAITSDTTGPSIIEATAPQTVPTGQEPADTTPTSSDASAPPTVPTEAPRAEEDLV